jgi:hypothetical protein
LLCLFKYLNSNSFKINSSQIYLILRRNHVFQTTTNLLQNRALLEYFIGLQAENLRVRSSKVSSQVKNVDKKHKLNANPAKGGGKFINDCSFDIQAIPLIPNDAVE